ncbi:MAG: hypothetical protein E7047_05485 [Lentisphaerae bacterium]|nr:hypothetical protein [Lentisphaerota bacterium]
MLKKLTLLLVAALCSLNLAAAKVKVDQTTKEKATISLLLAAMEGDVDSIWSILSPDTRQNMIKNFGSEAKAKAEFSKHLLQIPQQMSKSTGMPFQDAKELLKAYLAEDVNKVWTFMPQQMKQQGIKECGSEEQAKAMLKKMIPQAKKEFVNMFAAQMIKINGKWYFNSPAK